jgi:hypothetical protein
MLWWLLLAELLVVWLLWAAAAATQRALHDARHRVPESQRGGVSIVPIIPALPLAFWGVALLVDLVAGPWGTVSVGGLHAVLGAVFVGCIVRDRWRRRSPDKHS